MIVKKGNAWFSIVSNYLHINIKLPSVLTSPIESTDLGSNGGGGESISTELMTFVGDGGSSGAS